MLLKFIRKNTKILFAIILALMVVPFLFFGVGSIGKQDTGKENELKIKDKTIPYAKYKQGTEDSRLQMLADFVEGNRIQSSEQFEMYNNWFNQLMEQMDTTQATYRQIILEDKADKLGITASPENVKEWLETFPLFQIKGSFDIVRYNKLVTSYFKSAPAQFEKMVARILAVRKLQKFMTDSVIASSEETYLAFKDKNEKASVFYVEFNNEDFSEQAKNIKVEELKDYYEKNKEQLREPDKIKICYLLFDPVKFKANVNITQAEVEEYYESHKDDYKDKDGNIKPIGDVKETVSKKLTDDKAKELCQAEAVDISMSLTQDKKLADMLKLAKEKKMTVDEADYLAKGQNFLPQLGNSPNVLKAAWQMELNSISDIMSAGDKWVIISPMDIKPSRIPEFNDAIEKIKGLLKTKKQEELATQSAEETLKRLPPDVPFAMAVKFLGLKPKKSKPITRENELFTTETRIVKTGKGAVLVSLYRLYPAKNEEWEKEKVTFTKTYLEQKKRKFFQGWLNNLLMS